MIVETILTSLSHITVSHLCFNHQVPLISRLPPGLAAWPTWRLPPTRASPPEATKIVGWRKKQRKTQRKTRLKCWDVEKKLFWPEKLDDLNQNQEVTPFCTCFFEELRTPRFSLSTLPVVSTEPSVVARPGHQLCKVRDGSAQFFPCPFPRLRKVQPCSLFCRSSRIKHKTIREIWKMYLLSPPFESVFKDFCHNWEIKKTGWFFKAIKHHYIIPNIPNITTKVIMSMF